MVSGSTASKKTKAKMSAAAKKRWADRKAKKSAPKIPIDIPAELTALRKEPKHKVKDLAEISRMAFHYLGDYEIMLNAQGMIGASSDIHFFRQVLEHALGKDGY